MDRDYFQEALHTFNGGNWYGWKKDWTGEKRMSYENLLIIKDGATMPSEEDVNAKIQELKDAETQKENNKTSAQNKLKALGLTDAEIEAL
nr:hypothetical protein [uncultured Mediterranean phage uvMED]